jgi:SAM-dependent methyltransferase
MRLDVNGLRAFYASPLGAETHRVVARALHGFLGSVSGLRVLGIGYATPYLGPIHCIAERTLAFMPATQGVVNWPGSGRSCTALADPTMMPLPEAAIDRGGLVHALESVESPTELLQEVWRTLTPGGRMILVVPNRRGVWARREATPFGHGQPYSRSQLGRLMRDTLFSPEGWAETLYMPPVRSRLMLRTGPAWERLGSGLALPFAGLHVVDATKQLYRPVAVQQVRRARRLSPARVLVPAPSPG